MEEKLPPQREDSAGTAKQDEGRIGALFDFFYYKNKHE
jgi:hypothetical protein